MGNAGGQRPQQPNFRISVSTDGGAPPKNPHFLRHPNPLPNFPEWERILCNPNPPETVRIPSFISIFFENFEIHHTFSLSQYISLYLAQQKKFPASLSTTRPSSTHQPITFINIIIIILLSSSPPVNYPIPTFNYIMKFCESTFTYGYNWEHVSAGHWIKYPVNFLSISIGGIVTDFS